MPKVSKLNKDDNFAAEFTIVTRKTPRCAYCEAAKGVLFRKGILFDEYDYEAVVELLEAIPQKTLPFVFKGKEISQETLIGGYQELLKYLRKE